MILGKFFFFQAEDGIRDIGVTGVQTCALPISPVGSRAAHRNGPRSSRRVAPRGARLAPHPFRGSPGRVPARGREIGRGGGRGRGERSGGGGSFKKKKKKK